LETVKALASLGADVNVHMTEGVTPLNIAALQDQAEMAKAPASLGADVNIAMNGGATRLFVAARKGQWKVVKALTALGAKGEVEVDVEGRSGVSCMLQSCQSRCVHKDSSMTEQ
jgi:ankyrin repeat protein